MSYYGVPQSRRRFSLVASRLGEVAMPVADTKQKLLKDAIGADKGFFPVEAGHKDDTAFMHTVSGLSEVNLKDCGRPPMMVVPGLHGKMIRNCNSLVMWERITALQMSMGG